MSKVTNFDSDKTLKLSKKLSIDYETSERIVDTLQKVISTGSLENLDSIEVNADQKRIIEKILKKPTKPVKITKTETVKIQNGFVTHGCTVVNSNGDLNENKNVSFKVYLQKLNDNEVIQFEINEKTLKALFRSLNEIQALRDNIH